MIRFREARGKALVAGATDEEIDATARDYAEIVGTGTFNAMVTALNFHHWNNSRDEWTRLAGALKARADARKEYGA